MSGTDKPSGLGIRSADGGTDIETGHPAVAQVGSYNVELAEHAEARERDMSFKDAFDADRRLIVYAIGFSGTIIMEGYGLALITFLFSFSEFNMKYGVKAGNDGEFEVSLAHCFLSNRLDRTKRLTCVLRIDRCPGSGRPFFLSSPSSVLWWESLLSPS